MNVTLEEAKAHLRGVKHSELHRDVRRFFKDSHASMFGRSWHITTEDELENAAAWWATFLERWAAT